MMPLILLCLDVSVEIAMPATAVASTFDVVTWLKDRALNDGEYLQPIKMHHLLFLAQAYFAVAYRGQKLAPATFIADSTGPIEPDVWRVFASGRPFVESDPVPERVEHFLDSIWRRFGSHSVDYLSDLLRTQPPYMDAFSDAPKSEISMESMVKFYGRKQKKAPVKPFAAPDVEDVLRPRTMRSATGKPVSVQRWMPKGSK